MDTSLQKASRLRPLFLFIIFILLFHEFWNHSIFYRDSFDTFAPLKYLVAQGLGQGRVWLWYPWQ